jgi:CDP-diglyceride synthetase
MKITFQWIASVLMALGTTYVVVMSGIWWLYIVVACSLLGVWGTRRLERDDAKHGVVQLRLLLALVTAMGMQGWLTL